MDQAGRPARMLRHPQRAALDFNSLPTLFLITPSTVPSLYLPVRIIWRGGDDMDFIPVRSKISSQFPGVFTDACWFGVEVEADNEDLFQTRSTLFLRTICANEVK